MSERAGRMGAVLLQVLVVLVCMVLVVWANTQVSWGRLGLMVVGLAGILAVLYSYNRRLR